MKLHLRAALRCLTVGLPAVALLLSGCSDKCSSPEPAARIITGHLVLHGTLRATLDDSPADTTVSDASGIVVYLASGGSTLDSAITAGGEYAFYGWPAGEYRVFLHVGEMPFEISALPVSVEDDVTLVETLDVLPFNRAFRACPNPFRAWAGGMGTSIFFDGSLYRMRISVYNMANREVNLLADAPYHGGPGTVTWSGMNKRGRQVPPGLYWVVLESKGQYGWDLIFVVE